MILSNSQIHRALDEGRLVIEPRPLPMHPESSGPACPYQTTAVDLRLGDEISYFKPGLPFNIDLRLGKFSALFGPNSESCTLTDEQPFSLHPGRFVLAKTFERITLPISDESDRSLAARVEGKSSYARCGLLVHFTAPTIHAGFSGTITLEVANLGPLPIMLYPRAAICQLIIEEVRGNPFKNDSQFQHQQHPGGHRITGNSTSP